MSSRADSACTTLFYLKSRSETRAKKGNPWRWKRERSGNSKGRPPGRGWKQYTGYRVHRSRATEWKPGHSGNPAAQHCRRVHGRGFEPADVGRFIAAALRSDGPIAEDPAGYSLLQAQVKPAARPPAAKLVPAFPYVAARISGKRYLLDKNDLGLHSIIFSFVGEYTGLLELSLEDRRESHLMGLDGVYRVSRQSPDAPPVAVRGEWLSEKEFGLISEGAAPGQEINARIS